MSHRNSVDGTSVDVDVRGEGGIGMYFDSCWVWFELGEAQEQCR